VIDLHVVDDVSLTLKANPKCLGRFMDAFPKVYKLHVDSITYFTSKCRA